MESKVLFSKLYLFLLLLGQSHIRVGGDVLLPYVEEVPVIDWDNEEGDFMDDVKSMASWLLGYGQESTKMIKKAIRSSRVYVGKWAYQLRNRTADLFDATIENVMFSFDDDPSEVREDTIENLMDIFDDDPSEVREATIENLMDSFDDDPSGREGLQEVTSDADYLVENDYDVFTDFRNRSQRIANVVTNIYNDMTSNDENFRFDLIIDQITPDFSPFYYVCPQDCPTCNDTTSEILCRLCCPGLFQDPMSFTSIVMESSYSAMMTKWLIDNLAWTGLRTVFQSWLHNNDREQHDIASKEVKSMIRNFIWLQLVMKGEEVNSSVLEIGEIDSEEDFDVLPAEVCGYYEDGHRRKPQGRIMGGEEVEKTRQYPWQMSLATGFMGVFYQHRCGAALLSDKWVLSAAHCLHSLGFETLYVMGGFLDINEKDTAQIRKVEAHFSHENFVPRLYEQDVALLRLQSSVVYTPSLLPVCLPPPSFSRSQDYSSHEGLTAILTGWGRQWDAGPLSTQLEMVKLPVISNVECMDWYNKSGSKQFIPDHTFLCAGWEEGTMDACSGDSGGPLVVTRGDGRAEVIGIVSWGIGCGVKGRPGVYTRVSQFVPWIEKTIREYQEI